MGTLENMGCEGYRRWERELHNNAKNFAIVKELKVARQDKLGRTREC